MHYELDSNKNLVISMDDYDDDNNFLWDQEGCTEERTLADMCDGHTGWLGNQGPAPANIPALSQAPQLALGLEYDENNVPRWSGLYAFLPYEHQDWRKVLQEKMQVTFTKVA